MSLVLRAILALVLLWDLTAKPAHAYLDPGVGSHMLQLTLAGLLGGLFALRAFFQRLVVTFRSRRGR